METWFLSLSLSSFLSHYIYVFILVSEMIYFCRFLLYSKLLHPQKKGSGEIFYQTEMQPHRKELYKERGIHLRCRGACVGFSVYPGQ